MVEWVAFEVSVRFLSKFKRLNYDGQCLICYEGMAGDVLENVLVVDHHVKIYSRLPITRTFKGNRKEFELSGVRVIGSSKKIAESKVKNSFYCTVNILITLIVEMSCEN